MIEGVRVGGVVEFVEVVPLMFLVVTAMLVVLTRLEQGLGRDRAHPRIRAAPDRVARRGRRPRPRPRADLHPGRSLQPVAPSPPCDEPAGKLL